MAGDRRRRSTTHSEREAEEQTLLNRLFYVALDCGEDLEYMTLSRQGFNRFIQECFVVVVEDYPAAAAGRQPLHAETTVSPRQKATSSSSSVVAHTTRTNEKELVKRSSSSRTVNEKKKKKPITELLAATHHLSASSAHRRDDKKKNHPLVVSASATTLTNRCCVCSWATDVFVDLCWSRFAATPTTTTSSSAPRRQEQQQEHATLSSSFSFATSTPASPLLQNHHDQHQQQQGHPSSSSLSSATTAAVGETVGGGRGKAAGIVVGGMGFDGFTECMKVIAERCYSVEQQQQQQQQTGERWASSSIGDNKEKERTNVDVEEEEEEEDGGGGMIIVTTNGSSNRALRYCLNRYAAPFIDVNVVSEEMVVCADRRKNVWSDRTQRLVDHLISCAMDTLILPVYRQYAVSSSSSSSSPNATTTTKVNHSPLSPMTADTNSAASFGSSSPTKQRRSESYSRKNSSPSSFTKTATTAPSAISLGTRQVKMSQSPTTTRGGGVMRIPDFFRFVKDFKLTVKGVVDDDILLRIFAEVNEFDTCGMLQGRLTEALEMDEFVDALLMLAVARYADEEVEFPQYITLNAKFWAFFVGLAEQFNKNNNTTTAIIVGDDDADRGCGINSCRVGHDDEGEGGSATATPRAGHHHNFVDTTAWDIYGRGQRWEKEKEVGGGGVVNISRRGTAAALSSSFANHNNVSYQRQHPTTTTPDTTDSSSSGGGCGATPLSNNTNNNYSSTTVDRSWKYPSSRLDVIHPRTLCIDKVTSFLVSGWKLVPGQFDLYLGDDPSKEEAAGDSNDAAADGSNQKKNIRNNHPDHVEVRRRRKEEGGRKRRMADEDGVRRTKLTLKELDRNRFQAKIPPDGDETLFRADKFQAVVRVVMVTPESIQLKTTRRKVSTVYLCVEEEAEEEESGGGGGGGSTTVEGCMGALKKKLPERTDEAGDGKRGSDDGVGKEEEEDKAEEEEDEDRGGISLKALQVTVLPLFPQHIQSQLLQPTTNTAAAASSSYQKADDDEEEGETSTTPMTTLFEELFIKCSLTAAVIGPGSDRKRSEMVEEDNASVLISSPLQSPLRKTGSSSIQQQDKATEENQSLSPVVVAACSGGTTKKLHNESSTTALTSSTSTSSHNVNRCWQSILLHTPEQFVLFIVEAFLACTASSTSSASSVTPPPATRDHCDTPGKSSSSSLSEPKQQQHEQHQNFQLPHHRVYPRDCTRFLHILMSNRIGANGATADDTTAVPTKKTLTAHHGSPSSPLPRFTPRPPSSSAASPPRPPPPTTSCYIPMVPGMDDDHVSSFLDGEVSRAVFSREYSRKRTLNHEAGVVASLHHHHHDQHGGGGEAAIADRQQRVAPSSPSPPPRTGAVNQKEEIGMGGTASLSWWSDNNQHSRHEDTFTQHKLQELEGEYRDAFLKSVMQ